MEETKINSYLSHTISWLTILTYVFTLGGLILAGVLKIDSVSSTILPYYPRYKSAIKAIDILSEDPNPITKDGDVVKDKDDQPILATTIGVDSPCWPVMIDFMKSEIAVRKSDINDLSEEKSAPEELSPNHQNGDKYASLSEINYDRINSFFVIRVRNVLRAGNKPLTEPYRVFTTVPPSTALKWRRIYDFLSFEDFRLDVRKMLVGELEFYSIIMAIIAVLGSILLHSIKRIFKFR